MGLPCIERLAERLEPGGRALIDVWGVIHDGTQPYPEAAATLEAMATAGIEVIALTNASYRSARVADDLVAMGMRAAWLSSVFSAGEATRRGVARLVAEGQLGPRYAWQGLPSEAALLEGLPVERASVEAADFVLVTGISGRGHDLLQRCLARNLPMVCSNPDLGFVDRNGVEHRCAGALAAHYEQAGGRVVAFGKPATGFYREALGAPLDEVSDTWCIGDSIATDLRGADRAGLRSIWVCRDPASPTALARRCADAEVHPQAWISEFRW